MNSWITIPLIVLLFPFAVMLGFAYGAFCIWLVVEALKHLDRHLSKREKESEKNHEPS